MKWDLAQRAIPGARHITQDAIKLQYVLPFDQVHALVLVNGVLKVEFIFSWCCSGIIVQRSTAQH
jgi:hypothetical protein